MNEEAKKKTGESGENEGRAYKRREEVQKKSKGGEWRRKKSKEGEWRVQKGKRRKR